MAHAAVMLTGGNEQSGKFREAFQNEIAHGGDDRTGLRACLETETFVCDGHIQLVQKTKYVFLPTIR